MIFININNRKYYFRKLNKDSSSVKKKAIINIQMKKWFKMKYKKRAVENFFSKIIISPMQFKKKIKVV